jgi:hypothetical protein
MKAEHTIAFLAELLELTEKLQHLVRGHCRLVVAEDQDGTWLKMMKRRIYPSDR